MLDWYYAYNSSMANLENDKISTVSVPHKLKELPGTLVGDSIFQKIK
jgi:hypothetical protein